jgi:serine/threonine protein kinase
LRRRERGSEEAYHRLFSHEKRCLRLLNSLRHPNIIPLLGSYTQINQHYFLFPSFEMDLGGFFQLDNLTGDFRRLSTFISALHGLASALCAVHNLHLSFPRHGIEFDAIGYHHDLRPANVLVNQQTFVLADFGLGKLKSANEASETAWKAGTGDYLAPECMDDEFHHQDVGRSIDIWAFACLMAEVLTFARKRKDGLADFCKLRLEDSPNKSWSNSHFHGSDRNFRPCVQEWLQSVETDEIPHTFTKLILRALNADPTRRPRMAEIRERLAFFSTNAQYNAVYDNMTELLKPTSLGNGIPRSLMNLWFERERLYAFGQAFEFDSKMNGDVVPAIKESVHAHCFKRLSDLFKVVNRLRETHDTGTEPTEDAANEIEMQLEHEIESDSASSNTVPTYDLLRDVTDLVQGLWDILPGPQQRLAEAEWVHRILESQDVQGLSRVHSSLSIGNPTPIYERGAALALMKMIRLEMLSNPSTGDHDKLITATDVETTDTFCGHQLGVYQKTTSVLVEWMYYTPGWESVSPTQRLIVMSLKAKGFGSTTNLEGLRVLECIGFYEKTEVNAGYGFVYKIPLQIQQYLVTPRPTTLHELLVTSATQARMSQIKTYRTTDRHCMEPLLEDKLFLAHTLALFLTDFHTIGWVHENFHPNNIVFFLAPDNKKSIDPQTSFVIRDPYIVGLQKSRPAGESWHTEGPASDRGFQDYLNPRYLQSKRFSVMDDYYSFGLTLLEIGLWFPEQGWAMQNSETKTLSPEGLRNLFLEKYVPRLGPRMGSMYREVVELCLNDGLDDGPASATSEEKARRVFDAFIQKVVCPLAELARTGN